MYTEFHTPDLCHIPELRALWKEAFRDDDAFLDDFFDTAFSHKRCRIVTIDGKVVAALYWFDCYHDSRRIAYIYAVATAMLHRREGLCHKLMNDTHNYLKNAGYAGAILVPGNDKLFGFYQKLGYKTCCYIDEFHYNSLKFSESSCYSEFPTAPHAGNMAHTVNKNNFYIHEITKDEFAKQRCKLLPRGGVLQENENLNFLETQAKFYVGNDFLMTARVENDTLYALELLGDISTAPSAICALGCSKGVFRTPGNSKPFAMYLSFVNSFSNNDYSPSYFAFAFD